MQHQLPPGFRFKPTDEELITNYLRKKVLGEQLPSDAVIEGEVYGDDVQLPEGNGDVKEKYMYIFVKKKKKKKNKKGTKMNRRTKNGYWKDNGGTKKIYDKSGKNIRGTKRSLTFKDKSGSKRKKRWLIDEYGLVQKNSEEWVICKIKQKNVSPESDVSREEEDDFLTSTDDPPSVPLIDILMCAPGIDTNDVFEAAEKNIEIHVSLEGEDDCSTSIDTEIIEENPIQQTPFQNIAVGPSGVDDRWCHQSRDMELDHPPSDQSWDMDGSCESLVQIPDEIAAGTSHHQIDDPPSDQSLYVMNSPTASTFAGTLDGNDRIDGFAELFGPIV